LYSYGTAVDTIKRRKLQLFGRICRMDNNKLVKQIILEIANSTRSQ